MFGIDAEVGGDGSVGWEVLRMHERVAAGILREVVDGIVAGGGDPAAVELELYECGVGFAEENLVAGVAVVVAELEVVIVIGILETGLFGLRADLFGFSGVLFEVVEGEGLDGLAHLFGVEAWKRGVEKDGADGVVGA